MTRLCAWCGKYLGEKCKRCGTEAVKMPTGEFTCPKRGCLYGPFPTNDTPVPSHGMCPDCLEIQTAESKAYHAKRLEQRRSAR